MDLLKAAEARVNALVTATLPAVNAASRVFLPGSSPNWATLRAQPDAWAVVYPPQLVAGGPVGTFAAVIDVCARDHATARDTAGLLVTALNPDARAPKSTRLVRAVPIREEWGHRVSVGLSVSVRAT